MERLGYTRDMEQRRGQSLVEILIALAVGGMLIGTAATLMAIVLRAQAQDVYIRTATALNEELMGKLAQYVERQWYCPTVPAECGVYNLTEGVEYRLDVISNRFRPVAGRETGPGLRVNEIDFSRDFQAKNVCRDAGDISGLTDNDGTTTTCNDPSPRGSEDPSTQYVSVCTEWDYQNGAPGNLCLNRYFVRNRVALFHQTDWSGGPTAPSPPAVVITPDNRFDTSNDIDFTVRDEIKLVP